MKIVDAVKVDARSGCIYVSITVLSYKLAFQTKGTSPKTKLLNAKTIYMTLQSKCLPLLFALFIFSYTNTEALKRRVARIQFYMHDTVTNPNPSAIQVARPTLFTAPNPVVGSVFVIDNPLTVLPSSNSMIMGRAQRIYVFSSQGANDISLHMSLTIGFISEPYNGSTFSVATRNPIMNEVWELPIVGGTGIFRLACGYCLARTYAMNQQDVVIGYSVTLKHC